MKERRKIEKIDNMSAIIKKAAESIEADLLSDEISSKVEKFLPTGSTLLDLALGGGWAIRRIVNIVGDSSTGKSLLGAKAIGNAQNLYNAVVVYDDPETTFEPERAHIYGVDSDLVIYTQSDTVEKFFDNILTLLEDKDYEQPLIYVLDSLDALSSEDEMKATMAEASYGTAKAKKMSQGLRKVAREISKKDALLIIISQTRDRIGIQFGEKTGISGGKALKFYASQRIMLAQLSKLADKDKRVFGVNIRAKVTKNKISDPFREVDFNILFDMGIDDMESCLSYYIKQIGEPVWDDKKFRGVQTMLEFLDKEGKEEELKKRVIDLWMKDKVESGRKK